MRIIKHVLSIIIVLSFYNCKELTHSQSVNEKIKINLTKLDTIPSGILDKLVKSNNKEDIKFFLDIVNKKYVPKEYYFNSHYYVFNDLIRSNELLSRLQSTIANNHNPIITSCLLRHLTIRKDKKSENVFIKLLKSGDENTRYNVAFELAKANYESDAITKEVLKLINDKTYRTASLTDILIVNEVDTLNYLFQDIYLKTEDMNWKSSCLKYMSLYPEKSNAQTFMSILQESENENIMMKYAIRGLGKLNHIESQEFIIDKIHKSNYDYYSKGIFFDPNLTFSTYLDALKNIQTERAKSYLIDLYINFSFISDYFSDNQKRKGDTDIILPKTNRNNDFFMWNEEKIYFKTDNLVLTDEKKTELMRLVKSTTISSEPVYANPFYIIVNEKGEPFYIIPNSYSRENYEFEKSVSKIVKKKMLFRTPVIDGKNVKTILSIRIEQ